MNGVILDGDKVNLLIQQLAGGGYNSMQMGLGDTIAALSHATTGASLTAHEEAFTGYSRQSLTFGSPALTTDKHARAFASAVTFSNTGVVDSTSITFWFFSNPSSGEVVMAGLFDTPFVIPAGGAYITVPFFQNFGEIQSEP